IAWLPGHTCVGSSVDVANAHSSPLRFTTAPHTRVPWNSPPASPSWEGAATRNSFSCLAEGRPEQRAPMLWPWSWPRPLPWLSSWAEAPAAVKHRRMERAAIGLFICPSSQGTTCGLNRLLRHGSHGRPYIACDAKVSRKNDVALLLQDVSVLMHDFEPTPRHFLRRMVRYGDVHGRF